MSMLQCLHVKFASFDVDCGGDNVDVYDGTDQNKHPIGVFCGHNIPPKVLSADSKVLVKLLTDQHIEWSGFKLTWRSRGETTFIYNLLCILLFHA